MKQHIWIYGKRLAAVLTGIACLCAAAGCSKTNEINDSAAVPGKRTGFGQLRRQR